MPSASQKENPNQDPTVLCQLKKFTTQELRVMLYSADILSISSLGDSLSAKCRGDCSEQEGAGWGAGRIYRSFYNNTR